MRILKIIRPEDKLRGELAAILAKIESEGGDAERVVFQMANDATEKELSRFISESELISELKSTVRRIAMRTEPVIITGPSGVGKELIAKALHGIRPLGKFYAINCGGMPEALIESELFGHKQGAFTGANREHPGIIRSAENGTLFLDEIGEAPLTLQAKLLRALQATDGVVTVRPVGGIETYKVQCRIIAATKRPLYEMVQEGTFREDLYGRLMTFELTIPSLLERGQAEIIAILLHFGISVEEMDELDTDYWRERIKLFNVRALQSYAARKKAGL